VIRFEEAVSLDVLLEGGSAGERGFYGKLADSWGGESESDPSVGGLIQYETLQPGEYVFSILDGDGEPIEKLPLAVVAGENRVTVSLPETYMLEVELPTELAEARLELRLLASRERDEFGAEFDGARRGTTVRFEGLRAGSYSLIARHETGTSVMPVSLDRDDRVLFRGSPRQALLVRVRGKPPDDEGALREGDLVIGIGAAEFANDAELTYALDLIEDIGARWTLLVERPGSGRIDVEIEGGDFERWPGGVLWLLRIGRE